MAYTSQSKVLNIVIGNSGHLSIRALRQALRFIHDTHCPTSPPSPPASSTIPAVQPLLHTTNELLVTSKTTTTGILHVEYRVVLQLLLRAVIHWTVFEANCSLYQVVLCQSLRATSIRFFQIDLPRPLYGKGLQRSISSRAADGSNNNPDAPDLGKAGTPYARSVQQSNPITVQPNALMPVSSLTPCSCRDKFIEHPQGLSSLMFSFAALVIHSATFHNTLKTIGDETPRLLIRTLEAVVQALYDDAATLLLTMQRIHHLTCRASRQDCDLQCEYLDVISVSLKSNLQFLMQTLDTLLSLSHNQVDMAQGEYTGAIEWRMSRLSIIDSNFDAHPMLVLDPTDPESEDIVDIEVALGASL
ncbi:uncharacterized protein EDB91DRAFT_1252698 [Suillus paluster]|uniref:uncharacterized protein n=1 Tax=Suillus paluster TaxID=48578 RepID=UPI001B880382|nr:uncharacterized protein EDB91DRAFT_1252698 [Suillus paluster]KAG1730233.1 hypothetical protein EDB91DRAFT_1252698 [Suillus paluster]